MVGADSHRVSRVRHYLGMRLGRASPRLPGYHRLWRFFPEPFGFGPLWSLPAGRLRPARRTPRPRPLIGTGATKSRRFRLIPFRSPLLGESMTLSFPRWVLRCVSSPRSPPSPIDSGPGSGRVGPGGLPHSEIPGSSAARASPGLIAACHVLHRLLAPRHPPHTLSSLAARICPFRFPEGTLPRCL